MIWYVLIFLGCIVEGEFTLVAAGFGVHHQALDAQLLVPLAWPAAFLGDWLFFELGRRNGGRLIESRPAFGLRAEKLGNWMKRFPIFAVFLLRFQIGMRMIGHFSLGAGSIGRFRYLAINLAACFVWAICIVHLCIWFAGLFSGILATFS